MLFYAPGQNPEELLLQFIGIRDHSPPEISRAACNTGDEVGDVPSGATLGGGYGGSPDYQELPYNLFQGFIIKAIDIVGNQSLKLRRLGFHEGLYCGFVFPSAGQSEPHDTRLREVRQAD